MSLSVRLAVADDVARLAALGAEHRRRLAGWSPTWWRSADAADEIHPLWLGHIVGDDADVPPAPPHSFGGALDPWAEGALSFADRAGVVVGSPSLAAPPVYDPGGTVAVVDRIVGEDRAALVRDVLAGAADRGDVLVAVVAAADDTTLAGHLAAMGFDRTVDVYAWPEDGSLARPPSG